MIGSTLGRMMGTLPYLTQQCKLYIPFVDAFPLGKRGFLFLCFLPEGVNRLTYADIQFPRLRLHVSQLQIQRMIGE